jgi:hypothetical protein
VLLAALLGTLACVSGQYQQQPWALSSPYQHHQYPQQQQQQFAIPSSTTNHFLGTWRAIGSTCASPQCCCTSADLVVTNPLHFSTRVQGGPACGGQTNMVGDFTKISSTVATHSQEISSVTIHLTATLLANNFNTMTITNSLQPLCSLHFSRLTFAS